MLGNKYQTVAMIAQMLDYEGVSIVFLGKKMVLPWGLEPQTR